MFRGDWRILITLVGCLALAALGLMDSAERRYNAQRADRTRQHIEQIDRNRAGLPAFAEGYISNPDPLKANETERRNLAAQEASAVWAFWVVVASFFGTLITLFGTILLYQQIVLTRRAVEDTGEATAAMQKANEIAELAAFGGKEAIEQGKLGLRAWIVAEPQFRIYFPGNGAIMLETKIDWLNAGQTPALDVRSLHNGTGTAENQPTDTPFVEQGSGNIIGPNGRFESVVMGFDIRFLLDPEPFILKGRCSYKDIFSQDVRTTEIDYTFILLGNGDFTGADLGDPQTQQQIASMVKRGIIRHEQG